MNAPAGPYFPNRVARRLPLDLPFAAVWIAGLQGVEDGSYIYTVTLLDGPGMACPAFRVTVPESFDRWDVHRLQ
jgi:hypothetical protein